jgi:hypothetical protein
MLHPFTRCWESGRYQHSLNGSGVGRGQRAQNQPGRGGPLRSARIPQPDVADELTDLLGHIAALNDRYDGTIPSGSYQQLMDRYAELVQRSEETAPRRNAEDSERTQAAIAMAFTACTALTESAESGSASERRQPTTRP